MSTQTPPPVPPAQPSTAGTDKKEIRIVSHSTLFYWWPVWAIGFILGLLTYFDGHRLAVVPEGTQVMRDAKVGGVEGTHEILVLPEGKHLMPERPAQGALADVTAPAYRIAASKSYGVLFVFVLLLVIVITNVPMRGLWSVVVIVTLVLLAIIFQLSGFWEKILDALGRLHIYINAGGYFMISTVLLLIWLVTFLFFDRQIYMIFTPGQLRVRQEIGGGEAAYDTAGMVVQKQRNDLFRHWILGLGSGDLIVNTSGAHAHHFDLPNVLFVGNKVRMIEDMLREKAVVRG